MRRMTYLWTALLGVGAGLTGTDVALSSDGGAGGGTTCADGKLSGTETGKDCGGSCAGCPVGEGCKTGADCESKSCSSGGVCLAPSCNDEVVNANETDVYCGGDTCGACDPGKTCKVGGDCKGQQCAGGECVSTCSDGLTGGSETDIDCGGGVVSGCPACIVGEKCKSGADCQSRICQAEICTKSFVWNTAVDGAIPVALAVDSKARVSLAGTMKGTCDFGGGPLTSTSFFGDPFVARYDTAGEYLWAKSFPGSAAFLYGMAVSKDAQDNTFIVGGFQGDLQIGATMTAKGQADAFAARIDIFGNPVWATDLGSSGASVAGLAITTASVGVVIAGSLTGSADFGGGVLASAGGSDVLLVNLDHNGAHHASRIFGGPGDQVATSVTTGGGDVYLTGTMSGSASFGDDTLVAKGSSDVFVAKLDWTWKPLWSKNYGSPGAAQSGPFRIGVDDEGNVILAGSFAGAVDFGGGALTAQGGGNVFVAKLDANGDFVWSRQFNDVSGVVINSLAVDGPGNILLTGELKTQIDLGGGSVVSTGKGDAFVALLDAGGQHVWSVGFGDTTGGNDAALAGAFSNDKSVVLAGLFAGSISFGGDTPLTALGYSSMFLTKLLTP